MGEINNAGEEDVKVDGAEKGADNQDDTKSKDGGADEKAEGADKSDNESGDDAEGDEETTDDDEEDAEADKSKDDGKTKKPTPTDDEPKTRKRNVDFILERKNRKIEKLQKGNKDDADTEDEDEDIDEADMKTVGKVVKKMLSPFMDKQAQDEDAQEIAGFVKENPDFAPYADKVKKFAAHESRRNMPIKSIFYEVAGDDLLKIGAKRAKKAGDEAKETQAGGGSGKGGGSEKSAWDLTPEEFAQKQEEIRRKSRD